MFRRRNLVLAALAVVACDYPTEPPMWEQTWVVPGEDIVVGVADVLPAGVGLTAAGDAFEATIDGMSVTLTLGDMCTNCAALNGLTMPKPSFEHTFTTTLSLPASVQSATTTGDAFSVSATHDLSFDPIRPGAASERGFLIIEVSSDGAVVARDSISGDDVAFPAGVALERTLPIGSVDVTDPLDVRVVIHSPVGDETEIDTSEALTVELQPAVVTFSEATVAVDEIVVDAAAAELDLSGVDVELSDRIQSGGLALDIDNPFGLEGTIDLAFDLGSSTLEKSVVLVPGASSVSVVFTAAELQAILEAGIVDVRAIGTLGAPTGVITVRPGQAMVMESLLEVVILVGGRRDA